MQIDDKKIVEILLKENYVSEPDMKAAETQAEKMRKSVTDILLTDGLVTRNLLGQAVAESYNMTFADLKTLEPGKEQVLLLPEKLAREHTAVVFKVTDKEVTIATAELDDNAWTNELATVFPDKKVKFAYAPADDIKESFVFYLKTLDTRFQDIISKGGRIAPEILDQIIEDAIAFRASDIHLEPQETDVIIRFRIDGVLQEAGRLAKDYYPNILNRIKVQTHLPIDEHFSAQDGAIRYHANDISIDMRVSILPTLNGEKVVIRLLSQYVRGFTFADLGLSEKHQVMLMASAHKPFGMILVVGPTGSGKSTSLYALLKLLHRPEVNITTIEDPVEFKIAGINQIQVNSQTNLTFAAGLRSIARQDPDIILVGEIRDLETTDIAVNAALTGHLLLSTFHANDAATAVPRLLEMGTEPFLLSSTLELIIAQRLVRKICDHCKHSIELSQTALNKLIPSRLAKEYFPGKTTTVYKGEGCASCGHTGFRGRTAIFEFIPVTPEMRELMLTSPSTQQIWQLARSQGATSLFEDGIEKVMSGVTTIEELLRVAQPPDIETHDKKETGRAA